MRPHPQRALAALAVAATTAALGVAAASPAAAACADIHVVSARGTGEAPGLGITGSSVVNNLRQQAGGASVDSYAVNYPADFAQAGDGAGATNLTDHVVAYAAQCPQADIVLSGHSQGASVVDIAIGIRTVLGSGRTIPQSLDGRIRAVLVFGNPLRLTGTTIPRASARFGTKALDDCNAGDPVCAGGANVVAHITYPFDGSAAEAARFALAR